jgi:hypothetical protein
MVETMPPKEKKKRPPHRLFGGSIFNNIEQMFKTTGNHGIEGGGYSIQVTQTPEGTKVYAKIGKNADQTKIRQQLEKKYPGATIQIEGGRPLIKEISTKPVKPEKEQEKQE